MQRGRHFVPTDYCLELGTLTSKAQAVEDELDQLIQRSKIFESAVPKSDKLQLKKCVTRKP